MKINKLKILSIAFCCLIYSLWSETKCAEETTKFKDNDIVEKISSLNEKFKGENFQMNDFQCKFQIKAGPKKVYEAISEQYGLQGWWTVDCDAEPKEGSKATFRFGETYTVMFIEKLVPNEQILWKCLEQHHVADRALQKQDEWVGTHLIFNIRDNGSDETELEFTHQGLNESLECYDICEERWGHFLKKSLKPYIETGKGDPYNNNNRS